MASLEGKKVIVLGGGLSGLSAAHSAYEAGATVLLLDKSSFCGGNSTKATSGINGANTASQRNLNPPITDSNGIFTEDIIRGGSKDPALAEALAKNSGPGVEWLISKFKLDLSLVSRLGGHSQPRTHRGKAKFPGMTITYALLEAWEDLCEKDNKRCGLINKARGTKLITEGNAVVGCEWEDLKTGETHKEHGTVVLACGGFGHDFGEGGYIRKFRPDLEHLPTTNGEHCTGDAIKMAVDMGAETIDMKWIQVHPTGLVNPDEPNTKVKFLAAEALRGVGGILLDKHGNRFSNELGRRDYVTGRMWKCEGPFRLCLNSKASKEIAWHCKHYKSRGLMKSFDNFADACKDSGTMDLNIVKKTFAEHNEIERKMALPMENIDDAGRSEPPYDAYGGGKTWDKWGKKFFKNGPLSVDDSWHVAIVTPVIHYCMGGALIDENAQVVKTCSSGGKFSKNVGKNIEPIAGLYSAGEATGGIHGENRLGGNALCECVVFGRIAGSTAAKSLHRTVSAI